MGKLSEFFNKVIEKLKIMSTGKKIALSVMIIGVVLAIIAYIAFSNANKYGLLFGNMASDDAKNIMAQLDTKKVAYQVKGSSIYVDKTKVESLRLELQSSLTNGTKGYELIDSQSQLGVTDDQFNLTKQRATQGEIEKTIKSIPQVENARVLLALPAETAFVKDTSSGKASIYIQLKTGTSLNTSQVKAIASLVAASVNNIPKENVQIMDQNMKLLSDGVFNNNTLASGTDSSDGTSTGSIGNQQKIQSDFETKLEKSVLDLLEPVFGQGKVKVKINTDLDFDAKEKTQITYDPNKVEVSSHSIKETNGTSSGTSASSPIDNNMSNTATSNNSTSNNGSTHDENTSNYNVGSTTSKTISAPGAVKRLTASVVIDGKLDANTTTQVQNAVANAINFKADRGDSINVAGMTFDTTTAKQGQAAIDAMNKQAAQDQKMQLYKNIAYAVIAAIGMISLIILLRKSLKGKNDMQLASANGINVVIGDEIQPKERMEYNPLDLDVEDEKTHIEKEIKKYASEKPEQVADIIKSWLSEDEG